MSSWLSTWAAHQPDRDALSFDDQRWSYAAFDCEVRAWAAALSSLHGVGSGDRVAYLGHNHPTQLFVLFACARLGATLVPLNWRLTDAELRYQLEDCEPVVVVCAPSLVAAVEGSWPTLGLDAPTLEAVSNDGPATVGRLADPLLIVYTSGTTGAPKGAVLDQRAVAATAINGCFAHDLTSADRVLSVLPLFHVGGLCIQTVPALLAGASVRLHAGFDPGRWLDDVATWRPTTSLLVPATMAAIQRHPAWEGADLSSLRGIMAGSSVVPEALIAPFHERSVPCGQIYGSTETGPTALALRFGEAMQRVGSCGKPVPHAEVRLVDGTGSDVAAGQPGEVAVRGPNVLREYWRNAEATAAAFLPGGWFRTGDIGHCDAEGWWYIDDRRTDVVISGGENVYPAELEAVLVECDGIAEAAVIGRFDERWGEVPVAVVVRAAPGAAGADGEDAGNLGVAIDADAVRALFEGRLARFKHPHDVIFVEELPRNVMGKVEKYRLREQVGLRRGDRVS